MKYIVAAWAIIVITGFILEHLGRKSYTIERPKVLIPRTGTPIGALQLVRSRERRVVMLIKPPKNFEERLVMDILDKNYANHPQLDFSACVRPKDTQRGGTHSGGGES